MPTTLNGRQGVTFTLPLQYLDANAVPVNVTGWTSRAQLRAPADAASPAIDLTTANGGAVITDGPNGKLELRITAAQMGALSPKEYAYDWLATKPDGVTVVLLLEGTFVVARGITHA
jgi:hypothetical protein